jgi:hypothetical protein
MVARTPAQPMIVTERLPISWGAQAVLRVNALRPTATGKATEREEEEGEAQAEEGEAELKNGAVAGRLVARPAQWRAPLGAGTRCGGSTSLAARMLANAIAASRH